MKTMLSSKSLLVLSVFLVIVKGENNETLTTATVCVGECIKPTTLKTSVDRRMFGDWNEDNELPTPFHNFRASDKKRISRSEIWNWDYWCQLQRKVGTCSDQSLRFYYDSILDQCRSFKFSGCKGNKNNFINLEDCERNCKGSAFMEIKDVDRTEECSLQPNSGQCVAMYRMFYYDINDNECKSFIYGGCGGNANRFSTNYKCTKRCGQRVKERKRD